MKKIFNLILLFVLFLNFCGPLLATEREPVGIGAILKKENSRLFITDIIPNSPAAKADLRIADDILKIEGKDTATLSRDESISILQSKNNSKVEIVIKRNNEQTTIVLTPQPLNIEQYRIMPHWANFCSGAFCYEQLKSPTNFKPGLNLLLMFTVVGTPKSFKDARKELNRREANFNTLKKDDDKDL